MKNVTPLIGLGLIGLLLWKFKDNVNANIAGSPTTNLNVSSEISPAYSNINVVNPNGTLYLTGQTDWQRTVTRGGWFEDSAGNYNLVLSPNAAWSAPGNVLRDLNIKGYTIKDNAIIPLPGNPVLY